MATRRREESDVPEPNRRLTQAREALPSRVNPGECLSRDELAGLVRAYVYEQTGKEVSIDGVHIGKLERGEIRWPRDYHAALRAVLGVETDADLGFRRPGRSPATLPVMSARREAQAQGASPGVGGQ